MSLGGRSTRDSQGVTGRPRETEQGFFCSTVTSDAKRRTRNRNPPNTQRTEPTERQKERNPQRHPRNQNHESTETTGTHRGTQGTGTQRAPRSRTKQGTKEHDRLRHYADPFFSNCSLAQLEAASLSQL